MFVLGKLSWERVLGVWCYWQSWKQGLSSSREASGSRSWAGKVQGWLLGFSCLSGRIGSATGARGAGQPYWFVQSSTPSDPSALPSSASPPVLAGFHLAGGDER